MLTGVSSTACAYCLAELDGEDTTQCPTCDVAHHRQCWVEAGGCAAVGCRAPASPTTALAATAWPTAAAETTPEPEVAPSHAPPSDSGEPPAGSRRSRRWFILIALVLGCAAAGAAGAVMLSDTDSDGETTPRPAVAETARPATQDPPTEPERIAIPDVEGLEYVDAHFELSEAGFEVVRRQRDSDEAAGTVVSQAPDAGSMRREDSRVTVYVARERAAVADTTASAEPHRGTASDIGPAPQPSGIVVDPSTPTWIVVLNSLDVGVHGQADGVTLAQQYRGQGIEARVLLSTEFSSLNAGYWVVYSGSYHREDDAAAHCRSIRWAAPECYQRYTAR